MNMFLEWRKEKEQNAEHYISNATVLVAASVHDGIIFVTENPSIYSKTAEIYNRIGIGAIGESASFNRLIDTAIELASTTGLSYDEENVWAEDIAIMLGEKMYTAYAYPELVAYNTELVVAEINHTPETDKLIVISYTGEPDYRHQPYVIIGRNTNSLKNKINECLKGRAFQKLTTKTGIKLIKQAIRATRKQKGRAIFEVSVLKRSVEGDRFQRLEGEGGTS
ncbi:hypothetical protein MYX07_04205 [Patescibacteria group bacterium AH-259-L07]|nr:hypothetical protein [Patescibacteria group bacterium AH-259-L07]